MEKISGITSLFFLILTILSGLRIIPVSVKTHKIFGIVVLISVILHFVVINFF